jgi:hypothetical protein
MSLRSPNVLATVEKLPNPKIRDLRNLYPVFDALIALTPQLCASNDGLPAKAAEEIVPDFHATRCCANNCLTQPFLESYVEQDTRHTKHLFLQSKKSRRKVEEHASGSERSSRSL